MEPVILRRSGYTKSMKTAISLPDPLFEEVERLAKQRGMSRSQLYQAALREYVERHDPESITATWDALIDQEGGEPGSFATAAAARVLGSVEW